MKKFLLYAGAVALSIASFAVISAFKNKSVQDEGGHYVIVKSFQNPGIGEKSYFLICYDSDKTEVVESEYELTSSGIKERLERRTKNIQLLHTIFEKIRSNGYHLTASSSPGVANYTQENYIFEK